MRRAVHVLVLLTVAACGDGGGPSVPVPSLIVYGNKDTRHLNVLDVETGAIRELTTSALEDEYPALSSDGTRVVFSRGLANGNNNDLYLINVDGTGETPLTTGNLGDTRPSWSPDGQEIVFDSYNRGNHRIFIIRADGSGLRTLLPTEDRVYLEASWSPTGQYIAVMRSEGFAGVYHINLVTVDGSQVTQLTTEAGAQMEPKFSPNGLQVAYVQSNPALSLPL